MYVIREYKPGDSGKIFTLFDRYTPYKRDAAFWVWINRMLSCEKTIAVVGENKNQIVGHFAVIPQKIDIFGKSYLAGFAIHAFIHPEFRKTFMIFEISRLLYKIAKEKGLQFIYGFPNIYFRDILIKIDKWQKVSLFRSLEKEISQKKELKNVRLIKVENNFDHFYVLSEILEREMLEGNKNNYIKVNKCLNYYINRYLNHPHNIYKNFFIEKNGEKEAFLVLKFFEKNNIRFGHIIDYVSTSKIDFNEILDISELYFYGKVDILSVWKFGNNQKKILKQKGFNEVGFETFLGVKMLVNDVELERKLLNFDNWFICMGDSDAF